MFINKKNLKYLLILSSIISGVIAEQPSQKEQIQPQNNTINNNAQISSNNVEQKIDPQLQQQDNVAQVQNINQVINTTKANNTTQAQLQNNTINNNTQAPSNNIKQNNNYQNPNNNIEQSNNTQPQNNNIKQNNDVKISSNNDVKISSNIEVKNNNTNNNIQNQKQSNVNQAQSITQQQGNNNQESNKDQMNIMSDNKQLLQDPSTNNNQDQVLKDLTKIMNAALIMNIDKYQEKFHALIYLYIKKTMNNSKISFEQIDLIWKDLLKNNEQIKIGLERNKDKLKKYYNGEIKIDSIREIRDYYINVMYPNSMKNIIDVILNCNNYEVSINYYLRLFESLTICKSKLLENDANKVFEKVFIGNKQKMLEQLEKLKKITPDQNISLYGGYPINTTYQPLFLNDFQKQMQNINNINELNEYYNKLNNPEVYMKNLEEEASNEAKNKYGIATFNDDLNHILYYIKSNNSWALIYFEDYYKSLIKYCKSSIKVENITNKLKEEVNKLPEELKIKCNEIINKYTKKII